MSRGNEETSVIQRCRSEAKRMCFDGTVENGDDKAEIGVTFPQYCLQAGWNVEDALGESMEIG